MNVRYIIHNEKELSYINKILRKHHYLYDQEFPFTVFSDGKWCNNICEENKCSRLNTCHVKTIFILLQIPNNRKEKLERILNGN